MQTIKSFRVLVLILFGIYSLSGCTSTELASSWWKSHAQNSYYKVGNPYVVDGKTYYPSEVASYSEEGQASWYGPGFHGRDTANGEQFDTTDFTAAHRTLPMPSVVRVTNLDNGKAVLVRINDRGPFKRERIIDVSKSTAQALDFHQAGTTRVRVDFLPEESRMVAESAKQGHIMTLAEVQSKMMQLASEREQPMQPMNVAAGQTTPVQTENVMAPGQPAQIARAPITLTPPGNVLREPAYPSTYAANQSKYAPTASSTKIARKIYVQLGAYENKAHAEAVGKKVGQVAAHMIDVITRSGVKLYRVRLAAPNQTQAQKMLHRVNTLGYNDAKLVME